MPGRSNLRIRCPKGRGSSTLPSRTPSDLRIFARCAGPLEELLAGAVNSKPLCAGGYPQLPDMGCEHEIVKRIPGEQRTRQVDGAE